MKYIILLSPAMQLILVRHREPSVASSKSYSSKEADLALDKGLYS